MKGQRIDCYHCKNEVCLTCAQQLFDTTPDLCPSCGRHYLYPQLGKPGDIERDTAELEFHIQRMIQQCKSYITDSNGKLKQHTLLMGLPIEMRTMFRHLSATIAEFDEDYMQNMDNISINKYKTQRVF